MCIRFHLLLSVIGDVISTNSSSSAVDGWLMMIVQQEEKYDSLSKQIKTRKAPVSDELEERAPHC